MTSPAYYNWKALVTKAVRIGNGPAAERALLKAIKIGREVNLDHSATLNHWASSIDTRHLTDQEIILLVKHVTGTATRAERILGSLSELPADGKYYPRESGMGWWSLESALRGVDPEGVYESHYWREGREIYCDHPVRDGYGHPTGQRTEKELVRQLT